MLAIFDDFHKMQASNSVATCLAKIALLQSLVFRLASMTSNAGSSNLPFCAKPKDFLLLVPLRTSWWHDFLLPRGSCTRDFPLPRASCSRAKIQAAAHAWKKQE
jgi:hypothetical protein